MKRIATFATPLGSLRVRADEKGLVALDFLGAKKPSRTDNPADQFYFQPVAKALDAYFTKRRPLPKWTASDLGGTPFQRRVWLALMKIPYGKTRTYGEIAEAVGAPGAARAVGAACGANPLPLFIPCHRVVAANGKLGGFSGGIGIKKKLLALEGAAIKA